MTNSFTRHPVFADFDQLFNDYYSRVQSSVLRSTILNHHVKSEENSTIVEIEVPGVDPSEVKVRIEGRSLSVETPKGNSYITIGQRLSSEEATASLKHGLLTISIPKKDARIVEVKVHEA